MGLFTKKPKVVQEIHDGAWGHLVSEHGMDVDTLSRDVRCVERAGMLDGTAVTFMRVFKLSEAAKKGVVVTSWETFDEHPDLILFEGYMTAKNQAVLKRKGT
ncbi:MAG: hypothetical protein HYX79_02295 [Chloroflexi bacterium]|nr:hypothetical protein [Chloroflexota bacterium]